MHTLPTTMPYTIIAAPPGWFVGRSENATPVPIIAWAIPLIGSPVAITPDCPSVGSLNLKDNKGASLWFCTNFGPER